MQADELYWGIGNLLGGLASLATFVGSWWYCAATYGFLFGFGLGWLPSIILAVIVFFAVKVLWAPAALIAIALAYQIYSNSQTVSDEFSDVPSYAASHARDATNWLKGNSKYRILKDSDCFCEKELLDIRTKDDGVWKADPNYHPYFIQGDFNGDETSDFAFVVADKLDRDKSRVLIFSVKEQGAVPFLSAEIGKDAALFYGAPLPKPYRLLVGPFFGEGAVFEPLGDGQYEMR